MQACVSMCQRCQDLDDVAYKVHDVIRDENGCFIILDVEFLNKRIALVNGYGPSLGDQPDVFDKISNHIGRMGNEHVIAALLQVIGMPF